MDVVSNNRNDTHSAILNVFSNTHSPLYWLWSAPTAKQTNKQTATTHSSLLEVVRHNLQSTLLDVVSNNTQPTLQDVVRNHIHIPLYWT